MQPGDTGIRFNLALVKQHMAVVLNDQPIEKRNLDAMRRAMTGIDTAERFVSFNRTLSRVWLTTEYIGFSPL